MPQPAPTPEQDLTLVERALGGDPDAVRPLALRLTCVRRMLSAINVHRGRPLSAHDLEDLGQDVLILFWKKLGKFRGQTTLEGWLYRFCFLEMMNFLRTRGRRQRTVSVEMDSFPNPDRHGEGDLPSEEELEVALQEVGPPDEEVVRMKHFEGLSFEELAVALGIPSATAKTRYYRGLKRLHQKLEVRMREGPARD